MKNTNLYVTGYVHICIWTMSPKTEYIYTFHWINFSFVCNTFNFFFSSFVVRRFCSYRLQFQIKPNAVHYPFPHFNHTYIKYNYSHFFIDIFSHTHISHILIKFNLSISLLLYNIGEVCSLRAFLFPFHSSFSIFSLSFLTKYGKDHKCGIQH